MKKAGIIEVTPTQPSGEETGQEAVE